MKEGMTFYQVVSGENRPLDRSLQKRFTTAEDTRRALDPELRPNLDNIIDVPTARIAK